MKNTNLKIHFIQSIPTLNIILYVPVILAVIITTCKNDDVLIVDEKLAILIIVLFVLFNCSVVNNVPKVLYDVLLYKLIVIVSSPIRVVCEYNIASKIITVCINGILNTVADNAAYVLVPGVK